MSDPLPPPPDDPTSDLTPDLLVEATVNLPGLRRGERAHVDPALPYIADCLARELVVPVE